MKRKNNSIKKSVNDLISQAEAARLRNVTRAAIADLIRRGKISIVEIGGRQFVYRSEILNYEKGAAGRPLKTDK